MKLPKLYSRSTSGKISTWEIEFNNHAYRTISGFLDMKLTISEWTECNAKSYNTQTQQTEKQARALWKKKVESGMFEDINKIDDETFFEPMLAEKIDNEEINWKYRVFIQPKLDGLRNINQNNTQFSRNGKEWVATPHLNQNTALLDGEMYNHILKDDFNEIVSLCKKKKPTKQDIEASEAVVQYWVYDYPSVKGVFSKRYEELKKWFETNTNPKILLVPTFEVFNYEDIERYHLEFLEQGYEGSMIRVDSHEYENKRSKSLLKKKNFDDSEFIIEGVIEGIGKLTGKVGKLTFNDFDSAVNGTHEYLEELWNKKSTLPGKEATVKHFGFTPDGIPRFPKVITIRDYE